MKKFQHIFILLSLIVLGLGAIFLVQYAPTYSQNSKNGVTGTADRNPSFLVAGKVYRCFAAGRPFATYRVIRVDKQSDWVEAEMTIHESDYGKYPSALIRGTQWFNMSRFDSCYEYEVPKEVNLPVR